MKIKAIILSMLMALPMLFTSCTTDDDPQSAEWWNGKKFSALYTDENHDYFYYVLEFKYAPDNSTNDGTFKVTPYTLEGKKISSYRTYSGVWSVNYDSDRLSMVYSGYSTNYRWSFVDQVGDNWPNYKPNRLVYGPISGSSGDPFANVRFEPGEGWKNPAE